MQDEGGLPRFRLRLVAGCLLPGTQPFWPLLGDVADGFPYPRNARSPRAEGIGARFFSLHSLETRCADGPRVDSSSFIRESAFVSNVDPVTYIARGGVAARRSIEVERSVPSCGKCSSGTRNDGVGWPVPSGMVFPHRKVKARSGHHLFRSLRHSAPA